MPGCRDQLDASRRAGGLALFAVALAVACSSAAPAVAHDALRVNEIVAATGAKFGALEAAAYWTPGRMRAARPIGPDRARNEHPDGSLPAVGRSAPGISSPGSPPSIGSRTTTSARSRQSHAGFSRTMVDSEADPASYPYSTTGKVFANFRNLGDVTCSGTVVGSNTGSVLMTAGHCVFRKHKGFARNFTFVPGYKPDGSGGTVAPHGYFPAAKMWVARAYKRRGYLSLDLAAVAAQRNEQGKTLQQVAGSRGISFNRARNQDVLAFGYPADPPFSGDDQWVCDTRYIGSDTDLRHEPGPTPVGIACDLTQGASGGGWIVGQGADPAAQPGFVYALTAYNNPFDPGHLYGPLFRSEAEQLWVSAQLNCGGRLPTLVGTPGDDRLVGTDGNDVIVALGGNDTVIGKGGSDLICGGGGSDSIVGKAGADRLAGQAGRDQLVGSSGRDSCNGGPGRDSGRGCERTQNLP